MISLRTVMRSGSRHGAEDTDNGVDIEIGEERCHTQSPRPQPIDEHRLVVVETDCRRSGGRNSRRDRFGSVDP